MNSSQYWKNMRHSANLHIFYNILKENGFSDSDMVVYTADDFSFDERIYKNGYFYSDSYKKAQTRFPAGYFTPEMVYETIMGNHEKLIEMDENSNYLIYLSGHGNENFLKLHNKHFILSTCLSTALQKLSKNVKKVFIIFDTCRAESLLKTDQLPKNVIVLCTSKYDQDSFANTHRNDNGLCSIDDFAKFMEPHTKNGLYKSISTFFDEFKEMYEYESDLVLYPKTDWQMAEFFVQDRSKGNLTPFEL